MHLYWNCTISSSENDDNGVTYTICNPLRMPDTMLLCQLPKCGLSYDKTSDDSS